MCIWGLGVASYSGALAMDLRMPHTFWAIVTSVLTLVLSTSCLFRKDKGNANPGCLLLFGVFIGFGVVYYSRLHSWTPLATGALFALYIWLHLKATGRSYPFMVAACLVSAGLSLQVPWPNDQRCLLTIVGVGVGAILQGASLLTRHLQGHSIPYPETAPGYPGRGAVRVGILSFGEVRHYQVWSPEFQDRIRARYQSQIKELESLNFAYCYCDGENFALNRLLLIFPAIIVLVMLFTGEVMTIYEGRRLMLGFTVYASKDNSTFAHSYGLGTKFYTVFQDGTLLISKDHGDGDGYGPTIIVNVCPKSSISDLWASHQERIGQLEAIGKVAERNISHEVYADLAHRDTPA
jgi:hypothetical protein